ncbi:MAG: MFS transporter [Bauldia sp.]|nr:MFS transporter [Bauldia sp.]
MLGFVSMLMDISSEMIHALLPVYLVAVLGASTVAVGFIEGIAEATASITKVFSGTLSDWLGKRQALAAIGYGLAAITKPIFPLAQTIGWVVTARFVDRIGKGIRGAPRDALIADLTAPEVRGAAFGLRQALDTIGAAIGPVLAILFMLLSGDNYAVVFWIAVVPAFLSAGLITFAVRDPEATRTIARSPKMPLRWSEVRRLRSAFWLVVGVSAVFTLARFSEAFLVLRAEDIGIAIAFVPVVLIVMNLAYTVSAYPAGALSDRVPRTTLLAIGVGLLIAADIVMATTSSIAGLAIGVVLWGLHMGFTQGLFAAMVADTAPADLRGTAYGLFNLVGGVAMLGASVIAGFLWAGSGPQGMFLAGAGLATMSLVGFLFLRRRMTPPRPSL